jgi:protein transport protein SEC24
MSGQQPYDTRQQSYVQQPAPPAQNGHASQQQGYAQGRAANVQGTGVLTQPPVARAMGHSTSATASRPTTRTIGNGHSYGRPAPQSRGPPMMQPPPPTTMQQSSPQTHPTASNMYSSSAQQQPRQPQFHRVEQQVQHSSQHSSSGDRLSSSNQMYPPPPTQAQYSQSHHRHSSSGTMYNQQPASRTAAVSSNIQQPRIRPAQVPRPDLAAEDKEPVQYYTCTPERLGKYPAAMSNFIAIDEGNASPRFMRATLRCVPAAKEMLRSTQLPFAVEVTPMADVAVGELAVPVVDFGVEGPVRCKACRGYINSYSRFIDQGAKWSCNLCNAVNDAPVAYQCGLDGAGLRRDRMNRPELCRGSVDFRVHGEYCVRPLQAPIFVFCIDVSAAAMQSGLTAACLNAVEAVIDAVPGGNRACIGIMTFDKRLQFYHFDNGPHVSIAVDVEDPISPLPSTAWVLNVNNCKKQLRQIIACIPKVATTQPGAAYTTTTDAEMLRRMHKCAPIAALHAVVDGLKAVGGHVILMTQSAPAIGAGAMPTAVNSSAYGTDTEYKLYQPVTEDSTAAYTYTDLTETCAKCQICVDLVLTSDGSQPQYHVGTLGQVAHATGGQIAYITGVICDLEMQRQISAHIYETVRRHVACETVLKVRCSNGLTCYKYIGQGVEQFTGELEAASMSTWHSITCAIRHDVSLLKDGDQCYIQAALLYTSITGERLVRCHTLALSVVNELTQVYKSTDHDAVVTALTKFAAAQAMIERNPVQAITHDLGITIGGILLQYRKLMSPDTAESQLVLPETMRLLPLHLLCMQKCVALRRHVKGTQFLYPTADERAAHLYAIASMSVKDVMLMLYPRLYCVAGAAHTSSHQQHSDTVPTTTAAVDQAPVCVPTTSEKLSGEGVFILDTSAEIFMYVCRRVPASVLHDLFSIDALPSQTSDAYHSMQLVGDGPLSHHVRELLHKLRTRGCNSKPLRIILANSGTLEESLFISLLVEDQTKHGISYVEHLVAVHTAIQHRMK